MNYLTSLKKVLTSLILSVSCLLAYAQQTVSGTVIDDAGEPLIGVSIQVKGTTTGSITDFDGNFTLDNVAPSDILVFSYVGYASKELPVGNQKVLKVTLSEDTEVLDEVVVVGYGQMKKNDLTGSVSSVGNEAITSRGTTGVVEALQGSVAGVNISQASGRVGGSFDVEIRGKSSTNSDTKPIYVVDGIICDDIDWLNPQDIARIDVLKDASSTAIYGSRATAGVVQVTTKSGSSEGKKETKPSISYDMYVGWVNPARMNSLMKPQEFYDYRFTRFLGMTDGVQPIYSMGAGFGQMALQTTSTSDEYRLKTFLKEGMTTDWTQMVLRRGFQQNHYVAVNGSSEHVAYHFGVGFNQDKGIFVGDEQKRINLKGSIDATINKYVQAGINFNLSFMGNDYTNDDAVSHAFLMNPFNQPYDKDGNRNEQPGLNSAVGTDGNQFTSELNPLRYLEHQEKSKESWRALGNVYLQIVPVKGLVIKTLFAPNFSTYRLGMAQTPDPLEKNYTDYFVELTNYRDFQYTWDNTISYSETFAEKHSVNLMGLFSMTGDNYENYFWKFTNPLENTKWYNMPSGEYDATSSKSNYSEYSMMSWALRANYSYAGKYMVTATVRGDGSSKFAKGNQWGYFPSVALAWRMSEETWMQEADWITNLKWRLSYGMTGNNSGIGNYDTQQILSDPIYYPFGGSYSTGYFVNAIVDQNLTWETSKEWNAGLDFGFLRDRITGSVDFYNKTSEDLLYKVELPLEAGGGTVTTNVGSVLNRGVEVSLKTVNVETAGVHWETTFTLAHNTNRVLEINGSGTDLPNDGLFIGQPINNVYNYEWNGIVSDREMTVPDNVIAVEKGFTPGENVRECDYYYACYGWSEGAPIVVDQNGDGKLTDADKKVYSSDPKVTGSLSSTLTWKGLEFSFTLYGRYGGIVKSNFYSQYQDYSDRGKQHMSFDYYIPAGTIIDCDGVNPDGTYINPVYQESTHYGSYPFPALYGSSGMYADWNKNLNTMVDISYLKVKNITLAYSLQKKELEKIHLQKLRFYITVTNPFVATQYRGFDPEWAHASLKNDAPSTINAQIGMSLKF